MTKRVKARDWQMVKKLTKFERGLVKNWQDLTRIGQKLTKFDKNCQKLTKLTRIIKTWQEMSWIHKIIVKFGHSGQILSKFVNFWPIFWSNLVHLWPILVNLCQFLTICQSISFNLLVKFFRDLQSLSNLVNFGPFVILWTSKN